MENEYKKHWGEFKNEDDLREELDEEGLDYNSEESDFYDIDKSRKKRLNERDAAEKLEKFGEDRPRKSKEGRKKFINTDS